MRTALLMILIALAAEAEVIAGYPEHILAGQKARIWHRAPAACRESGIIHLDGLGVG